MFQERTYSILFLCFLGLLFPCPLYSLRGKDSASTLKLGLYFPLLSVKNATFLIDFSLMKKPSLFLSCSSQEENVNSSVHFSTKFSFSVQDCNYPVFLSSKSLLLDDSVLAAAEFRPLLVSNDLLNFKNGGLLTTAVFNNEQNRCLKENQNNTILLTKNWIFEIFMPDTSQFDYLGNKDVLVPVYTTVFAAISVFSVFLSYVKKIFRRKKDDPPNPYQDSTLSMLLAEFRRFTYSELSFATKYFHNSELLGYGIVASVYSASFPESNTFYAVKKFNQNFSSMKCYETEVRTIHRLRHQNILELRGWCNENSHEPLLVYDYMPNRSLYDIFSLGINLLWPHRYNIAVGLAKALVYIHYECDPPVIHSDIKEENVLLDAKFNPKLSDFGLSLTCSSHASSPKSKRESTSKSQNQDWATPKVDVFLYGSLLLELCCRRNEGYMHFIRDLRSLKSAGRLLEAADDKLGGNYNKEEMLRLINLGLCCVDEDAAKRPSMKEVLKILLGEREEEKEAGPSVEIEINE